MGATAHCDLRRIPGPSEVSNTLPAVGNATTIVSMTSQLTREVSTSDSLKTQETSERIYLQPWFLMAVLCSIAIVVLVVRGG